MVSGSWIEPKQGSTLCGTLQLHHRWWHWWTHCPAWHDWASRCQVHVLTQLIKTYLWTIFGDDWHMLAQPHQVPTKIVTWVITHNGLEPHHLSPHCPVLIQILPTIVNEAHINPVSGDPKEWCGCCVGHPWVGCDGNLAVGILLSGVYFFSAISESIGLLTLMSQLSWVVWSTYSLLMCVFTS